MAKRKRPTAKTARQGQTIYLLAFKSVDADLNPVGAVVEQCFLKSHKIRPESFRDRHWPWPNVRDFILRYSNSRVYYSRRRAERAAAEFNRQQRKPT